MIRSQEPSGCWRSTRTRTPGVATVRGEHHAERKLVRRSEHGRVDVAHRIDVGALRIEGQRQDIEIGAGGDLALAWARRHGALIIEDDYDGEFRYDRAPLGSLQGLDPDRVVYAGTASKTLAPGLRLAWLALPTGLVQPVVDAKLLADRHTAVVEQLTLAELITSGAYDRHVRRRRLAYRHRRDQLLEAVAPQQVEGISAGLHAVLRLPAGITEEEALGAAAARGLALEGLETYRAGPATRPPAVVVGYATPPDHAYRSALARLVKVLTIP